MCQEVSLSANSDERADNYSELIDAVLDAKVLNAIRVDTYGNIVLGASRFQREIKHALGRTTQSGWPERPRQVQSQT